MKYCITGSTGFIGQKIIEKLIEEGNEVVAIVRPNSSKQIGYQNENLEIIACDLSDINSLPEILEKRKIEPKFDHFIHLGWQGTTGKDRNDRKIQLENEKTSLKCLKLAERFQCQTFFFAGSQAEYGNIEKHHYYEQDENNKCYPENEYGKAKLNFGKALLTFPNNIKKYHGRIFSVYGPNDQPNSLIETMIKKLTMGEDMILGPCLHDWNFTYIDDLAQMIIQLVNSNAPSGIYNLASKDTRPLKDFVREIVEIQPWNGNCIINGKPYNPNSDIPLRPNTSKIREYVEIEETQFKEGISKTIFLEKEKNNTMHK